jgi:hypothetical protein
VLIYVTLPQKESLFQWALRLAGGLESGLKPLITWQGGVGVVVEEWMSLSFFLCAKEIRLRAGKSKSENPSQNLDYSE